MEKQATSPQAQILEGFDLNSEENQLRVSKARFLRLALTHIQTCTHTCIHMHTCMHGGRSIGMKRIAKKYRESGLTVLIQWFSDSVNRESRILNRDT